MILFSPFAHECAVRPSLSERLSTANASGHGNKAAKRESQIRTLSDTERQLHEVFGGLTQMGLTASDVDRLAEQYTEGRTLRPRHNTPHA